MEGLQVTMILAIFLVLLSGHVHSVVVNKADEDRAIAMVNQMIQRLEQDRSNPPRVINPTAKLIRLIFHDCATGCNGCLDVSSDKNFGLEGIYDEVNSLYDQEFRASGISRGDFYALAGIVAIRIASERQDCFSIQLPPNCVKPKPSLLIRYGRKDCPTSPNSPRDFGFPDAHKGLNHVIDVFGDGMGMTERQVVALVGAHTMGMATPKNSGFQGPWALPATSFDNGFYRVLVSDGSGWHQSQLNFPDAPPGANPRYQWDDSSVDRSQNNFGGTMMLNTDMALFKRMAPDASGRETEDACRTLFTNCRPSRTASIVLEYAKNNTKWHEDFGGAFQILIEHGYPRNHLVVAGQDLPILIDPDVEIPPTEGPSTDALSSTSTNVNETIAITIVLILVIALMFGLFFLMIIVLH